MIDHPYQLRKENYEEFKETLNTGSGGDYLSWSVCWDKLKQMYPTATHELVLYNFEGKPFFGAMMPDGSVIVHCRIHYENQDGNAYTHNEYLAVRDKRHQANLQPTSADIENTYRRALAKAVSTLTGYGISLWMNEDLRYKIQSKSDQGTSETEQGKIVDQNKDLDLRIQNRSNNISN